MLLVEQLGVDYFLAIIVILSSSKYFKGAMGAGLHQLSATAVAVGQTSQLIYTTEDKKKEKEQEEKRRRNNLIAKVLPIFEDVRLQCPETHTGLIVAYTVCNQNPENIFVNT